MQAIKQVLNGAPHTSSDSTSSLTNGHSSLKMNGKTDLNGTTNGSLLPSSSSSQFDLTADLLQDHSAGVELSGYGLTIGKVVAAARKGKEVRLGESQEIRQRIDDSVAFLQSKLGQSVYGVTTGFGGSADTRTEDPLALQKSLLEHQLCGVLPTSFDAFTLGRGLENSMPFEVVRGSMLIRANSLLRGHSAIRWSVLETLVSLINHDILPVIPLRGSISASGDLSPLSYIAGALTGHPDVKVRIVREGREQILPAPEALALYNITPVSLQAKEGLAVLNGTAVSASFASIVLHDSHFLHLLSQATTALTVEAMCGHVGSFSTFCHDVTRPHPGQIEVAKNIRTLLEGSGFAVHNEEEVDVKADEGILRQDRYPLRCSAQWLGPITSDLAHSHAVLTTEINSTTDNPLIDVKGNTIWHGGNFMASAVTSATEKTRLGLQQVGKMSFAQLTELLNCSMNRGLPSCLAAEDPSTNYHGKGCDIAAAAYTSELGFLANPVSTHVQPAEMANQAINSLALISARKTSDANDVLSLLLATHLYCVLQAIDLRAMEFEFKKLHNPSIVESLKQHFGSFLSSEVELEALVSKVKKALAKRLDQTASYDLEPRWHDAFSSATGAVVEHLSTSPSIAATGSAAMNPLLSLNEWKLTSAQNAIALTRQVRESFWSTPSAQAPALQYLGRNKALYLFVRETVGVKARRGDVFEGKPGPTIGSSVSKIFEAIKTGKINQTLIDMLN
ncbi:hypothetical protein JCM3765_007701 [Sporobolomyces pararoseus]